MFFLVPCVCVNLQSVSHFLVCAILQCVCVCVCIKVMCINSGLLVQAIQYATILHEPPFPHDMIEFDIGSFALLSYPRHLLSCEREGMGISPTLCAASTKHCMAHYIEAVTSERGQFPSCNTTRGRVEDSSRETTETHPEQEGG